MPSSIHLKPELRLDGQLVASGSALRVGTEPVGAGAFTKYGTNQWDETQDQLIVGQQTAIGVSIQGISPKQLETLKTRMEQTKTTLERAQASPQNQREAILSGITGEHITGDMLTATIWAYFASLQSYGTIAGPQMQVVDLPALGYGLMHVQVQPRKLYGIVTTGVSFKGLNIDVGHVRSVRWVKDDNPASSINNLSGFNDGGRTSAQNRWVIYNGTKGQYSSSMEHVVLEQLWGDQNTCQYIGADGTIKNPGQPICTEAVSAVKAIAIAQSQGQKIYTINADNRATALPKLSLSGEAGAEIRAAIMAGKEVTFHEKAINAHGWTGVGYIIVDPDTGAGAYLIEGKGNGSYLLGLSIGLTIFLFLAVIVFTSPVFTTLLVGSLLLDFGLATLMHRLGVGIDLGCFWAGFKDGITLMAFAVGAGKIMAQKIGAYLSAGVGLAGAVQSLFTTECLRGD